MKKDMKVYLWCYSRVKLLCEKVSVLPPRGNSTLSDVLRLPENKIGDPRLRLEKYFSSLVRFVRAI